MSTDLLIDAIERLENAIAEAKETTRECHAARKDLLAVKKELEAYSEAAAKEHLNRLFIAAWDDLARVTDQTVAKMVEDLARIDRTYQAEIRTLAAEVKELARDPREFIAKALGENP